jgi:hypothetical protein
MAKVELSLKEYDDLVAVQVKSITDITDTTCIISFEWKSDVIHMRCILRRDIARGIIMTIATSKDALKQHLIKQFTADFNREQEKFAEIQLAHKHILQNIHDSILAIEKA